MSRLVPITHCILVDLGIPQSCVRDYSINMDLFFVNQRRIRRHIRRNRRDLLKAIGIPKEVKDWSFRRLRAMERHT